MNLTLSKSSRARETSRELVLKIDHSKDNLHQNHHPVLKIAHFKDDLHQNHHPVLKIDHFKEDLQSNKGQTVPQKKKRPEATSSRHISNSK